MNIKRLVLWTVMMTIVSFGLLAPKLSAEHYIRDEKNITNNKKEGKLDIYLTNLASFECPNCGPNYKRVDSNKRFSYGCLQFQLQTFISMSQRYHIATSTESKIDIISHIYSCDYQKAIAKAMFEDDPVAASYHWYTTIYKKGLGLPKT